MPSIQPAAIVNNGYPGSWYNASWDTVASGLFGDAMVSNTTNGSKQSMVAWWFPCRPGNYDVQVTWQPGTNYSANTPFDVYNALTWISQANVNEQNAPGGVTDQGVVWQSLGIFTITNNVLHVSTWNSPTDGAICVDGVPGVPSGATGILPVSPAALLESNQLEPIVAAAEARWAVAGVAPALIDRLKQTQIIVNDLPAGYLGLTEGNEILLSRDAAGFGWFVDPTPGVNEEFAPTATKDEWKAIDPRAVDRIDLLSVVEHEMGHILGLGDLDASLDAMMSDRLGVGVRRFPDLQ